MQRSRRQLPSGVAVMEHVEYGMDFAEVVPISQAITKYLIQWGDEDSPEGIGEAEVLVVMTRAGGLLLAAPVDFFAEEQLAEGNTQQDDLMLGMSTVLKVTDPHSGRGPPSFDLHKPSGGSAFEGSCIFSTGRPEVGHNGPGVHKRIGHYHLKACGDDVGRGGFFKWRRQNNPGWPRKRKGQKEGRRPGRQVREDRGRGFLSEEKEDGTINLLGQEVTFVSWALTLPRLILSTRSHFAWFLASSFSVKRQGLPLHTVIFPLPVPFDGIFAGGGPGLSKKRLSRLATRRLVHVMCMALNFLHGGHAMDFEGIRRPPGRLQLRCIRRLFNYVVTSGSRPEAHPVPPGRGGPELISCMWRLERFLATQPELGGVYTWRGDGVEVPTELGEETLRKHPELQPYRSLQADRLKLKGTGDWPIEEYIEGPLWLPYVEPAFLLHGASTKGCPVPVFHREDEKEYFRLAMKWEKLGLLRLHEKPIMPDAYVRVFNAFKSAEADRMIGDRRRVNYMERHLGGPSSQLPAGPMLTSLHVEVGQCLHGSITDRRDFYHQCQISPERSATNLVPFSFDTSSFEGTKALEEFCRRLEDEKTGGREKFGDRLGLPKRELKTLPTQLYPSFGALYQGDHLGVEFALSGHQGLLAQENLLPEEQRIVGKKALPDGPVWRALIIDDFFVISREDEKTHREETEAYRILGQARAAYQKHRLPGSPEKDVLSERLFKAAGAEIDSRQEATKRRLTLISAPLSKRLGLAAVSLRVAALPAVTPSLMARLSGSWVSVLLYRRCLASAVEEMFALGNFKTDREASRMLKLPRKVASELGVLSALAPMMATNAMAGFSEDLYATDASMQKGAIVRTRITKRISAMLWKGGDRQGHYTMLDNNFAAALAHLGEEREQEAEEGLPGKMDPERERPFVFDFVEVFGGIGAVSESMASLGMTVAPVLDITWSRRYNLSSVRLLEWCLFMLDQKRFKSILLAPPCTSFSPACHPAVRSYRLPKGFNRKLPKVIHGNTMAFRALTIMRHAVRRLIPSLLEQPRLSKMAWLSAWRWLLSLGCAESVLAGCQFGSPHRKEFRMLCFGLAAEEMERKCRGGHVHIPIAGKYTAPSAMYTPEMAMHIATFFKRALRREEVRTLQEEPAVGKESVIVNDLLLTKVWSYHRDWWWKKRSHINVLEAGSVENLMHELAEEEEDSRVNICVDSMVAKGAIAKGRSSAYSLQPTLRRSAAYQVAGGVFPALSFSPTRWNPGDIPTRDKVMPPPVPHSILDFLSAEESKRIHATPLPRSYSNWTRSLPYPAVHVRHSGSSKDSSLATRRSRAFLQPAWT